MHPSPELAWQSPDRKVTSVQWPAVVDARLDELLDACIRAGENTSRSQILAALVCDARLDGDGLGVVIRNYRRMSVDEFTPGSPQQRKPGRRRLSEPSPDR